MINPFRELITNEDADFGEYLAKINIFKIFEPIFKEYQDKDTAKKVIRFIAYGYSMDSDQLSTSGNNWGEVSRRIYNKVGLEDDLFEEVALLKNDNVRYAIEKWIQFQNDDNWVQYVHYRDLRRQMLAFSLSDLKKSSGEIDIDAKYQSVVYSKELLALMNQALDSFIQNHSKLKSSVEALNKASKDKVTRNASDYAVS